MSEPVLQPRARGAPAVDRGESPATRECRMRDCHSARDDSGFCESHRRMLAQNIRWCPVRIVPLGDGGAMQTLCGLCGAVVWPLVRLDEDQQNVWCLDTQSSLDGRCWVVSGGFRVVHPKMADRLRADRVPLFRTHPSICPGRPDLTPDAPMPVTPDPGPPPDDEIAEWIEVAPLDDAEPVEVVVGTGEFL